MDELRDVEIEESAEDARVQAWRVEQLSELGLSNVIASAVAPFVDRHEIAHVMVPE